MYSYFMGSIDNSFLQNGCKDIKLILYIQISIPQIRHSNDLSPHFRQFVAYRKGEFWGSRKDARKMHGVFWVSDGIRRNGR